MSFRIIASKKYYNAFCIIDEEGLCVQDAMSYNEALELVKDLEKIPVAGKVVQRPQNNSYADVIKFIREIKTKYVDCWDNTPVDKKYVRKDLDLIIKFIEDNEEDDKEQLDENME